MKQKIFILGASGNVGRELISQIIQQDTIENHVNPSQIIGLANSSSYIFDAEGIDIDVLENISNSRGGAIDRFTESGVLFQNLQNILELVKTQGFDGEVVFADVTAGKEELLEFHKSILLDSHNFLVTANKNPISLFSVDVFKQLTRYGRRYDTNTTVMGGAGILNFVEERTNGITDDIHSIEGVFSGTLGYILSELEKQEKTFSQIVRDAKNLGYTEPNPWDDLNGLDVARKLVILARYAGHDVDIKDIRVTPLINEKYAALEGEEFLSALENEDAYFEERASKASSVEEVLRYTAKMQKNNNGELILEVGLRSVPKQSDLGTLSGTSNLALISTDILAAPLPHVIKSRGAGLAVTAGAVRVGISKMLPNHLSTR